jgi:hypothetical protein
MNDDLPDKIFEKKGKDGGDASGDEKIFVDVNEWH